MENVALTAFILGLISASSLPMGAVTALFWIPHERMVASMMAFGAGALLAALTIDLVGGELSAGSPCYWVCHRRDSLCYAQPGCQ